MLLLVECELWLRKAAKHSKQGLMGHTSTNMEDSSAESNFNYEGRRREVSEDRNIHKWPRDISCDILVNNMAAFCPCQNKNKNLLEYKLKTLGLMAL